MKSTRLQVLALCFAFCLLATSAFATTHTVNVNSFSFAPNSLNVQVGDTIHFVGQSGSHTATSVSVPSGAATFDGSVNQGQTFDYVVTVAGSYSWRCSFHASMTGTFTATGASATNPDALSLSLSLAPNPVAAVASLSLNLPQAADVSASLFDISGREVAVLLTAQALPAGNQALTLDFAAASLPAGLYVLQVRAGALSQSLRLLVAGR